MVSPAGVACSYFFDLTGSFFVGVVEEESPLDAPELPLELSPDSAFLLAEEVDSPLEPFEPLRLSVE